MLFAIAVAGHSAHNTAKAVDRLVNLLRYQYPWYPPLSAIYNMEWPALPQTLKAAKIGCYSIKSTTYKTLANYVVNKKDFLRSCTVEDLETIRGIGPKTSRFFLLHSRPAQRLAVLDTHILKWLRSQGVLTPATTPPKGSKLYKTLEEKFLELCDSKGWAYAEADLKIWNYYSSKKVMAQP